MPNKVSHAQVPDVVSIARQTMIDEGFQPDFPASVEGEVRIIDVETTIAHTAAKDLRKLLWSSIDNVTSRDLDQVEYVEKQNDGTLNVKIGIANVAAFVLKGMTTDAHAFQNATSVYTGVATFPMLPEELSTNKTSLLQGNDRLAIVIDFDIALDGTVQTKDVYQALIYNRAKLSYDAIGKWLDRNGKVPEEVADVPELKDQIQLQLEAAELLGQAREKHGALKLDTIQATPVLDEAGHIVDLSIDERNSARDIIENFMVAANVAMAEFLERRQIVSLRRVVRTPENWPRIVELAAELHENLPETPDVQALAEFLERRRAADSEHFADLSLAIVKLLGPGDYVVQVPGERSDGHFGLAVQRYTHSTAPNRRYADLITQRLLKACIENRSAEYTIDELQKIAKQCNERESAARKVERKMRKVAAAVLMRERVGQEFDAIVTGVTPKGTFARIVRPPVDGMVVRGERGLKVGQHAQVKLLSTDADHGFIDFAAMRH